MTDFARLDQQHVWHPFTQMRDWLRSEPLVITDGRGSVLVDTKGREYLDANASIWTNLHGHRHPRIDSAIRTQLGRIAHSSALGLANEPASQLAARLAEAARLSPAKRAAARLQNPSLKWIFFSDDGSTAMEVALKLAYEFARRTRGTRRPRFLSLEGAYHGDTVGAVSLGHIDLFHQTYGGLLFRSDQVMAPYCYRCPFNRAKPERADAREYRRCDWECVDQVARCFEKRSGRGGPYAGFVIEPLLQGAAGMIPQPAGWLRKVAEVSRAAGTPLIADEVMTGFGRTGVGKWTAQRRGLPALFASHHESVQPDFMALAKGLTGGYLPMAATLTTPAVFDAFLGDYAEFKTFFHGHSYTGNQLGAAAGLASLDLLEDHAAAGRRARLEGWLSEELRGLWTLSQVGDIRQVGLVAGIELVRDWRTREPFDLREQAGIRVCQAMARRGVLTRPIGNVVPFLPAYCTTRIQLRRMITALVDAVSETLPG